MPPNRRRTVLAPDEPALPNSTFASRRAAREAREAEGEVQPPRRKLTNRAGADADTDVEITYNAEEGADRVRPLKT